MLEKYDNHQLQNWRICPLKGYYRHEQHLIVEGGKVPALEYGIAAHKGLDELYRTHELEKAQLAFLDYYESVFETFDPNAPDTEKHDPTIGMMMLRDYWNYWEKSIIAMELLAVEQYFVIDVGLDEEQECPYCTKSKADDTVPCIYCNDTKHVRGPLYCGVVDKVFLDSRSKFVVGMDHKTTSMLTGALINAYKISQQFRGYVYWLKRHSQWKDQCGEYFCIDLLLKTKKTKYNPDDVPFYRDTVLAQPEFLNEWWDDMVDHIKEIRKSRTKATVGELAVINGEFGVLRNLPRQNSDSCNKFNRVCQYYDLCSQPRSTRDTLAEDLYELDTWDPLNRDDEG